MAERGVPPAGVPSAKRNSLNRLRVTKIPDPPKCAICQSIDVTHVVSYSDPAKDPYEYRGRGGCEVRVPLHSQFACNAHVTLVTEKILADAGLTQSSPEPTMLVGADSCDDPTCTTHGVVQFNRDQFGVIWFMREDGRSGLMSASAYQDMRTEHPDLPAYGDLEPIDALAQNVIGIPDSEDTE